MNKKHYIAPEMTEVMIPGKLMLSINSEDAQEVLSRRRGSSFEPEDGDTNDKVWSRFESEEEEDEW